MVHDSVSLMPFLFLAVLLTLAVWQTWIKSSSVNNAHIAIELLLKVVSWVNTIQSAFRLRGFSLQGKRFSYQVRVQARATGKRLEGAKVRLEMIEQAPLEEATDSEGLARFFIETKNNGAPARLIVHADGFASYTANIDLTDGTLPRAVLL
jgi:hypothetical protein